MISEILCLDLLHALHGSATLLTRTWGQMAAETTEETNSLGEGDFVRPFLANYSLADIDAATRWLTLGGFMQKVEWGMRGPWVWQLTPKGVEAVAAGAFPAADSRLFYQVEAYDVFVARQFWPQDEQITGQLYDALKAAGYVVREGKADGLEQFRQAIIHKIRRSRFFIGLMTHRARLETGKYASSVWLYQETGAAVALGKSPLILVEDGMDDHYAGELQRTYEYIPFDRRNSLAVFAGIAARFDADLTNNRIPIPARG